MIAIVWRRHRFELIAWYIGCAALVALLVTNGHHFEVGINYLAAHHCPREPNGNSILPSPGTLTAWKVYLSTRCVSIRQAHLGTTSFGLPPFYSAILSAIHYLPYVAGVLFGAPLVARVLMAKTGRLIWTQGMSRRRWLMADWGITSVMVLVPVGVIALLLEWWGHAVMLNSAEVFAEHFDTSGFVFISYTFFALTLGVVLGTVLRSTVLGSVAMVAGYVAASKEIWTHLRSKYLSPVEISTRLFSRSTVTWRAWVIRQGSYRGPHVKSVTQMCTIRSTIREPTGWTSTTIERTVCLAAHHIYVPLTIQPLDRYWLFQGIESALYVGLSLVLLLAALWVLERRPA